MAASDVPPSCGYSSVVSRKSSLGYVERRMAASEFELRPMCAYMLSKTIPWVDSATRLGVVSYGPPFRPAHRAATDSSTTRMTFGERGVVARSRALAALE